MKDWLVANGETGELIREFDWSSTPVGPLQSWPQSLRTAVNFMIAARQPVYIAWGAELTSMYNDSYLPILGEKHPAAMGKTFQAIWPEIWDEYRPYVQAVMAGEAQFWVDQAFVLSGRPNRPIGWFTASWTPLRDEQGIVAGFLCVGSETTERVLAERQLVESMDEGYCVIESIFDENSRPVDYRFIKSNPAFSKQTGLQDAEGRLVTELIPDIERHWIETYGQVALTGQPTRFINEAPSMDRWFDVYAFRIAGSSSRVGILFRDITERTLMEQKLKEADRRKDEFLAMLAHELRNPLAPIGAAAELLQLVEPDPERVRHTSAVIARQVSHMTGLIDDLLDVSRVTRGLVTLDKAPLDMRDVIADAVEQVAPLMQAREHHFALHLAPQVMAVRGDRKRLVQVIGNILNNAAKYTRQGGHVSLRTEATDAQVRIEVSDDGIGMTPELAGRVFDLFAQAERSSDRSSGGLGLGLALVKSLVELHGGTVTCSSNGIGSGSVFSVCLPRLAQPDRPGMPLGASGGLQTGGRSLRILLVDDNQDAAAMLAMLLEALGHQVLVEHGSHRALERVREFKPQVCLLDIGLPEIDGYELAKGLRAMPDLRGAVLIALTGYGQQSDLDSASAAGFDHHLVKPVDTRKLVSLLAAITAD